MHHLAKGLLSLGNRNKDLGPHTAVTTLVHTPGPVQPVEARIQRFRDELAKRTINIAELKSLSFYGIPDKPGIRAVVWKLLLGYLPPDSSMWDEHLARKRTQYLLFCEELIVDPKKESALGADGLKTPVSELNGHDVTDDDHPLSLKKESKWYEYFKDSEILDQITRDVMRTHPDMHFFSGDSPDAEEHREEMKRALFIFAKLNPGLRYIQGMNELYAPLYYLFRTDPDRTSAKYAEADAFYCFVDLLSEFRDHFCQQLDNSQSGIRATIGRLMVLLQHHDMHLQHHLVTANKVDPQFFAFRWITLLLTQEFSFPDAMRIWDTLLSDRHGRTDCLLRVCCAMLQHVRDQLLDGDFSANVKLLQRFPAVDVNTILTRAAALQPMKAVLGRSL